LLAPLRERASAVVNDAAGVAAQAHPATKLALRELLRSMNSYYSNGIEGQSTTPRNILAALYQDFSHWPEIVQLQRIAVAHIEAEKVVSRQADSTSALSADFAKMAHGAVCTSSTCLDAPLRRWQRASRPLANSCGDAPGYARVLIGEPGIASGVQDYYGYLAAADAPRYGDLDRRGNLTERGLIQWVDYFLRVCEGPGERHGADAGAQLHEGEDQCCRAD